MASPQLNIYPYGNLEKYLQKIRKFPFLSPEEELDLSRRWRNREDLDAAHKITTSHLRFVAKLAMRYRGYGLPLEDLIGEGNLGLLEAVKRFDPERGFRFATYAIWWIKASIQEYILHNWSLVKMGTTGAQKKLFFNLNRLKRTLGAIDNGDLRPEQVAEIARSLGVPEADVVSMNRRLNGHDHSLNAPPKPGGEGQRQDWLADDVESQESKLGDREEMTLRKQYLAEGMKSLNGRALDIVVQRNLTEKPATLEDLSHKYNVSRERIRQVNVKGLEDLAYKVKLAEQEALRRPSEPAAIANATNREIKKNRKSVVAALIPPRPRRASRPNKAKTPAAEAG